MKIVKSQSVELAIDPLSVYFIINRGQEANVIISSLNQSAAFTLDLYSYKTLQRSAVNDLIPSREICDAIENYNVIVRLFNGEDDCCIYAFENIDVNLIESVFQQFVHSFILNVAEQNISLLEQEISRELKGAEESSVAIVAEDREYVSLLRRRITRAKKLHNTILRGRVCEMYNLETDYRTIPGFVKPKLRTAVEKTPPKTLEQEIENLVSTINEKDVLVNAIVELFNKRLPSSTIVESQTVTTTIIQPTITIGRISVNKYNRSTTRFGVIVTANGERYNITFGSTDATMLYISALLRYKVGVPLYLYELYNNSQRIGFLSERMGRCINRWLSDIYNRIITKSSKTAAEWLEYIKDRNLAGRPIHQAKSNANRYIKSAMSGNPAATSCFMQTMIDENKNTYYAFNLPCENIFVDEQLLPLLESIPVTPLFK